MYIPKLSNSIANFRRFIFPLSGNSDNAVARIADVNYVINKINTTLPYRAIAFSLTSNKNGVTMMTVVNGGGGDECVVCDPCGPGQDCGSVECYLPCRFVGAKASVISGIVQLALGVYEITLNNAFEFVTNPRSVGVYPSALPSRAQQIEVSSIVNNKFQIRTFDNNVPSGLVLRNHAFKMEFYVYNINDLK